MGGGGAQVPCVPRRVISAGLSLRTHEGVKVMSFLEDAFKGNVGPGLAIAGAAVLAPTIFPAVGRMLRPVAKTVIKTGMMLYRETLAGVGDVAGDLGAQARPQLEEHGRSTHPPTASSKS